MSASYKIINIYLYKKSINIVSSDASTMEWNLEKHNTRLDI